MHEILVMFERVDPLFWSKNRLKTFKHWPFVSGKNKCNPENMAAAGFFAVGGTDEPDSAECFICHKQLDGWEKDDDPWEEHKKHQPSCLFVKIGKCDELNLTFEELFQLMNESYLQDIKKYQNKAMTQLKLECDDKLKQIPQIYAAIKKSEVK